MKASIPLLILGSVPVVAFTPGEAPPKYESIRPPLSQQCLAHRSAVISDISVKIASDTKGLGAFAKFPIKFGTYLGDYSGETMTLSEVQARFWGKRKKDAADEMWSRSRLLRGQSTTGNYLLQLVDGSFVDAEDGDLSTWTRFMNHANEETKACNVRPFLKTEMEGDTHRYPRFFAMRDIEAGEELCWDYGEYFTEQSFD
uniref:SET domain-containing protein n=1 Tax=Helicotheca tamesis TaxID=374047 RepID=A0A6U0H0L2_9STRA|mmetsp:Transcript_3808/g.5129  ORF Transcript_3808/g.5129 Transcript_3808/m.5129 type:complete len:200 (+) Transcript_3808:104-703(+)|eukprot:CAMPEP_0185726254 /NCGR_PEP_ID=MMETSP1171-20130828/2295_1 /TAXON_ID=374046 /ORGANISM="Helicotheca tamensis, Strain CCMP826" /LENGTH=199 /DNA_ID=CAMNT_0028394569 /DNA_START=299 /DNA_END=898 /DNA_ORIENTATION=-